MEKDLCLYYPQTYFAEESSSLSHIQLWINAAEILDKYRKFTWF